MGKDLPARVVFEVHPENEHEWDHLERGVGALLSRGADFGRKNRSRHTAHGDCLCGGMETNTNQETFVTGSGANTRPSPNSVSSNLGWGAIFGGGVAALGIASMLYALGLALGLSWIDPQDPSSLRPTGVFSGIWLVVVSLVALFVGGYVAARGAGVTSRGHGALHGLVMWGLSVVAGAWLIGNVASAVVRSGAAVGGAAMSAMGDPMGSVGQLGDLPRQLGVSSDDMLAPVNERLRSAGKPEVTAEQLENATRDVVQRSAREGRLDRETLI